VQDDSSNGALTPARFGAMIAEGYTAPRQSMARILSFQPSEQSRLLMVVIGTVISMIGYLALGQRTQEVGLSGIVFGYAVTTLAAILQYYVSAWVIGTACRAFGGKGQPEQDRTMIAWLSLVTSPVSVIMLLGLQGSSSPVLALLVIIVAIVLFILLSAYIAEVHGFHSTARVAGAMMALMIVISLVMSSFISMPVPA